MVLFKLLWKCHGVVDWIHSNTSNLRNIFFHYACTCSIFFFYCFKYYLYSVFQVCFGRQTAVFWVSTCFVNSHTPWPCCMVWMNNANRTLCVTSLSVWKTNSFPVTETFLLLVAHTSLLCLQVTRINKFNPHWLGNNQLILHETAFTTCANSFVVSWHYKHYFMHMYTRFREYDYYINKCSAFYVGLLLF